MQNLASFVLKSYSLVFIHLLRSLTSLRWPIDHETRLYTNIFYDFSHDLHHSKRPKLL